MDLDKIKYDPRFQIGASNAIRVCLRLQPEETITIITDRAAAEIAASLKREVQQVGSQLHVFVLEEFASRPLRDMPTQILEVLSKSQASIYAASAEPGELRIRMQMVEVINRQKIRHGHMVNITKDIMLQGMQADFSRVDALSSYLIEKARKARYLKASTAAGTDIHVEFSPELKWVKTSGFISPEKWGNLPGGEIFTSPSNINGVFVVDGVVGNYLCPKYGDLQQTPLRIEIENTRIKRMDCENDELLREFGEYVMTDENSNRVGEFAIGTNLAATHIIGNILQDEKMPGIHLAFGHPYSEHTGQSWNSSTHIDCVGRQFNIWFEEDLIMEDGKFVDAERFFPPST